MVEQGRFKKDSFDGLPIGDVPYLRTLVKYYRDNPHVTTDLFFSLALRGFYDCMWDGLDRTAGHIIYRLSDAIEKPQRETMDIYPSSTGSIIMTQKKKTMRSQTCGIHWKTGGKNGSIFILLFQITPNNCLEDLIWKNQNIRLK